MDKAQEAFEKTWLNVIGTWNPMLQFMYDKYYPISATYDPHKADSLNTAWFIFKNLYDSKNQEVKIFRNFASDSGLKPCTCHSEQLHIYYDENNFVICKCLKCKRFMAAKTIKRVKEKWNLEK